MTYVRTPVVKINGTPADPDTIALPLTITAGRREPDQQPEPGGCTFTMPLAAVASVPKRGHTIEVLVELDTDLPIFTGRVINVRAVHEPWQAGSVAGYEIQAAGWSSTYANLPLGIGWRIGVNPEDEQFGELQYLWTTKAGYTLDAPPLTYTGLDTTTLRNTLDVTADANLLPTLQDLATRTGALIWETPTDLQITGNGYREDATPAGTIPAATVPEQIDYTPAELINDLTFSYGAYDQFAMTATYTEPKGIFEWEKTVMPATPTTGEANYSTFAKELRLHRTDYNGDPQTPWIAELKYGDLIVVRDLINDTYAGLLVTAWPAWSANFVTIPVQQLDGDWDATSATGVFVAVWSNLNPPRATRRAFRTASQTEYGIRPAATDTGSVLIGPASTRANAVLDRWKDDQWIASLQVRSDLATSQEVWDDLIVLLAPNTLVEVPNLWAEGGRVGPYDNQMWIEGVTHEWNRTDGGRLIHTCDLVLTANNPDSAPAAGTYPSTSTYPATTLYPGGTP